MSSEPSAAAPAKVSKPTKVPFSKTNNANLQAKLESWVALIDRSLEAGLPAEERTKRIREFCVTFVPPDVAQSAEDVDYFCNNLVADEEYYVSIRRDLNQCADGHYVESISPSQQRKKATFVLLPLPELGKLMLRPSWCFIVFSMYIYPAVRRSHVWCGGYDSCPSNTILCNTYDTVIIYCSNNNPTS